MENKSVVESQAMGDESRLAIVVRKRQGLFENPVNRILGIVIASLVIWSLATVLLLLLNGTINLSGAPQRFEDVAVLQWQTRALSEDAQPFEWQLYVVTLINSGRLAEAEEVINSEEFQDIDVFRNQEILYCTALLEYRKGNFDEAIALYLQVLEKTQESYDEMLATGKDYMNWALSEGRSANYANSLLDLTGIYMALEDWPAALEFADRFIEIYPQEAGVLIDRAMVKEQLGDFAGALADYQAAAVFLPDNQEIIDGIKRVEGKQ